MSGPDRRDVVVRALVDALGELAAADEAAIRRRFRKMAADPYAFYRGSTPLFYADVAARDDDRWIDERTGRVWIHGDLHAENFGTYMASDGQLVFDVNDFDEAYVGPFTWDLRRFAASLGLIGWQKAIADDDIATLIGAYARAYVDQVHAFLDADDDRDFALRLDSTEGAIHRLLLRARLSTRIALLDEETVVDGYERRFRRRDGVRDLADAERDQVLGAFDRYLETIPEGKRDRSITYRVKDVVGRSGFGIGSAGLAAYNVLIEGRTQALENDLIVTLKQGNVAAPSRVVDDDRIRDYFDHHGHRTAVSQRALQAHADPLLGHTEIDGTGYVVSELSPHELDLGWEELTEPDHMRPVVVDLGRATAKVHCVSDEDSVQTLVDFQTEDAIAAVIGDDVDALVEDLVTFGREYAVQVRDDHRLFVEAFREDAIAGVASTTAS